MVNRRQVGYAIIAAFVVAFGFTSFVSVEFSLRSPQQPGNSKLTQRAEAVSAVLVQGNAKDADNVENPETRVDETATTAKNLRAQGDKEEPRGSEMNKTAGSRVDGGQKDGPGHNETKSLEPDDQIDVESDSKPTLSDNSTLQETESLDFSEDGRLEDEVPPLIHAEIMTAKLIAEIEGQESDCLAPMHVHLLWIGDLDKAPLERHKYVDMGYNLTVHTSAEVILDGFQPHVARALKLAIPSVVGFDFLKFLLLYKYGGLVVDADTYSSIDEAQLEWPADCDVVFGKEAQLREWDRPIYRESGGNTYGMNRPFQILNWAMAASKPRSPHVKRLIEMAMMHFFGRHDMEGNLIQDISGSGLMSDYVALLHEEESRSYEELYRDESKYVPVQGLCLTDGFLHGQWIHHMFHGTWKAVNH